MQQQYLQTADTTGETSPAVTTTTRQAHVATRRSVSTVIRRRYASLDFVARANGTSDTYLRILTGIMMWVRPASMGQRSLSKRGQ